MYKRKENVVADALSCLPQKCTSCEDSENLFYDLVECHNKEHTNTHEYDFHLLSYEHLETAQKLDPHLMKDLLHNTCKYISKEFLGGGNDISLICYNNKIVVPKQSRKYVID